MSLEKGAIFVQGVCAAYMIWMGYVTPSTHQRTADFIVAAVLICSLAVLAVKLFKTPHPKQIPSNGDGIGIDWKTRYEEQKARYEELSPAFREASQARTEYQQKYAECANKLLEIERYRQTLRQRLLSKCDELQGLLDKYGDGVKTERQPQENAEQHMHRLSAPDLKELRVKFIGDYRLTQHDSVLKLRDEIKARCGFTDPELQYAISYLNDEYAPADNLVKVIVRFWDIARTVKV